MSGPKTSRYTLTAAQRQRQLQQIEENLRRIAEQLKQEERRLTAAKCIRQSTERMNQIVDAQQADRTTAELLRSYGMEDRGGISMLGELDGLKSNFQTIISETDKSSADSLETAAKQLKDMLARATDLSKQIQDIAVVNQESLRVRISSDIDAAFTIPKEVKAKEMFAEQTDYKADILQELVELSTNRALPPEIHQQITDCIEQIAKFSDRNLFKNYSAIKVVPLLKTTSDYLASQEKLISDFQPLYDEYRALCKLNHATAQIYACSQTAIIDLRKENARLRAEIQAHDEQSYINTCLDEVMVEMGYDLIGHRDVTKRSGKHFRHQLYTYENGTAVDITYSSDGRIAMELGGIGTTARIPDAAESEQLCRSMEHFCADFKELEQRLLARGVVVANRISLLPPEEAYAQIINTADYQMTGEATAFHVKKQKNNATGQSALHME